MEQQQFFKTLAPLMAGFKHVTLVVSARDGRMTISVHVNPLDVKDPAVEKIVPLTLTGTAEELDSHFFETIQVSVEKTSSFFTNLCQHEASVEKARKTSDIEVKKRKDEQKKESQQQSAAGKEAEKVQADDKQAREMLATLDTLGPDNLQKQLKSIDSFLETKPTLSEEVKAEVAAAREKVKDQILSPSLF